LSSASGVSFANYGIMEKFNNESLRLKATASLGISSVFVDGMRLKI
jgi:hypothetical protein